MRRMVHGTVGAVCAAAGRLLAVYERTSAFLDAAASGPTFSRADPQEKCAGRNAYTPPLAPPTSFFCPAFFAFKDPKERPRILIHELMHTTVPTSADDFNDKGHYQYRGYTPMGMEDSFRNSDSYANFAVDGVAKKK